MIELVLSLPLLIAGPVRAAAPASGTSAQAAPPALTAPELRMTLAEAVSSALADSPALRAAQAEEKAAASRGESRWGGLWPQLSLESSYRFSSEVPELTVVPGKTQSLGDHHNYSVGPSLNWTLWDQGARRQAWLSAVAAADARSQDSTLARRQVRLKTRLAYFQAQLALEQVRLLGDSLKLAQSQHGDVEKRREAGASSRLDSLQAHHEVLTRLRQFRQARSDLAAALRDLFMLTGRDPGLDLSLPLDGRMLMPLPADIEPASVAVFLDRLDGSLAELAAIEGWTIDASHPGVAALRDTARSAKFAANGTRAGLWPRLGLSARTSLEYPNGPVLEDFHQNAVGVSASMPLFEFGRTRREAEGLDRQALAAEERAEGSRRDLVRDWQKAKDQLLGLKAQKELCLKAAAEAHEAAGLTYESYKAGRVTFIEVQTANLRELEALVQTARTDAQSLVQLAAMASLSGKE
ncbi:MAG: TolC family protein [Elusimicrobia bacterium]|nr:TolC family protein [Elusimicrobiota bacterium]